MPLYTFRDVETDEVLELFQPISESVPCGMIVEIGGRMLERQFDAPMPPVIAGQGKRFLANQNYVPMQVGLWDPDAPHHDEMGRCVITNESELRAFKKATGADDSGETIETPPSSATGRLRNDECGPRKLAQMVPHSEA